MQDCPYCHARDQWGPICLECGKSLCEDDIKKMNLGKVDLIEKYTICYNALKNAEKLIKNELYEKIPLPDTLPDISLLKRLPKPKEIDLIDIICVAESISCSKLEAYYKVPTDSGERLGDFIRQDILEDFSDSRRLIQLSRLYPWLYILD
jgi:hypothetical protein